MYAVKVDLKNLTHLTGKRVEWKPSAVSDHLLPQNHDSNFNEFSKLFACPVGYFTV